MSPVKIALALALLGLAAGATADEQDARLDWSRRLALSTPVSGVIVEVLVEEGDRVPRGQVMLRLDEGPIKARVASLEAERVDRENNRDEARRELGRTQELYDRTLLAEHDLAVAKIQLDSAEAALKATEAALVQARWEQEYSTIRAPFEAWVLRRHAEPGQTVVSQLQAQPLIEVAEAGVMLARLTVDAKRLARLQKGQALTVKVDGDSYRGSITNLGLEAAAAGQYPVEIRFATAGRLLRAGRAATVVLP